MGAFACEGRRVANWAGLSALGARDEIVRILLIFFMRVSSRLQLCGVCKVELKEEARCYLLLPATSTPPLHREHGLLGAR